MYPKLLLDQCKVTLITLRIKRLADLSYGVAMSMA